MRFVRLPILILIAGVFLLAFLIVRFVVPNATLSGGNANSTYVEAVNGTPRAINPLLCDMNEADRDLCSLTFSGLTKFDASGEVVPDLATWSISNGISYTFKLRADARWHDGVPVTADDVLFTISLLQAPSFPGRPDVGALWQSVKASKRDNFTVDLALAQPFAPFLDFTTIGLLPQHVLSGTQSATLRELPFNTQPIGNGAWRVIQVNTNAGRISTITLEPSAYRPPDSPKPKLSRLIFRYYNSAQAALDAFDNNEVDGVATIPIDQVARAQAQSNMTLHTARQAHTGAIIINQRKDSGTLALTDRAVRQALAYALDRERLIREAMVGQATIANSLFTPDTWAFKSDVKSYSFDRDRAIQLLRSAGYELRVVAPSPNEVWQKDGEPVAFTLTAPDEVAYKPIAEAIAKQWRELGIVVEVQYTRNIVRDSLNGRQFQVALVEFDNAGDPDPYALWHASQMGVSGQNYTGYDNKDVNSWLEEARQTTEQAKRIELYYKFQDALADDVPAIPLYYSVYRFGVANYVQGIQLPLIATTSDRFRNINDWQIVNRTARR